MEGAIHFLLKLFCIFCMQNCVSCRAPQTSSVQLAIYNQINWRRLNLADFSNKPNHQIKTAAKISRLTVSDFQDFGGYFINWWIFRKYNDKPILNLFCGRFNFADGGNRPNPQNQNGRQIKAI